MRSLKCILLGVTVSGILGVCGQSGALQGTIVPSNVKRVARVTGAARSTDTIPGPNRTDHFYNVGGTDLGIAWEMGNGTVGLFFGDTYGRDFEPGPGGPGDAGDWRSNVLAFSADKELSDGITFDSMRTVTGRTEAREIIPSRHDPDCRGDHTMIPTAAIHAGNRDIVHCMNINCWGVPGKWRTNYSALFFSEDNGNTWNRSGVCFAADSKFAQAALAKKDGYVYLYGTPAGRQGAIYLLRVPENKLAFQNEYEYWARRKGWVKQAESSADPVVEAPAGEMSVIYNKRLQRWIMLYLDVSRKAIVLRDAIDPQGVWSSPKILVRSSDYPGLYGSFIYPPENDTTLYFLMSVWKDYNVFLMKADLKRETE
ncbi:carbohydrate-binding protein [Niabella ginsenosidivorans]|uniref:Carbohydrate-binding protein n=1 Tax=Niabella ginsenosidivorans TaxID=1176587 RepID=A0A1A9I520_9BACT|nr:DUF4185 domain-containing protein [Niabella ginsenosidivorans]ANH81782.1 carbohydrate-binding protein [Niabella ginsenosidivorans]